MKKNTVVDLTNEELVWASVARCFMKLV